MTAMARPALLYFLLWLGVTLSTAMDLQKRMIGGQTCGNNDGHYHVEVIPKDCHGNECVCGGSLIRDQWVLTAAHCVEPGDTVKVIVNVHPGTEKEEMDIADKDIHKEPNGHDVMLLKLPKIPQKIHKIEIPAATECANDMTDGDTFQIAGHGINAIDANNKYLKKFPTELQCLNDVPVVKCDQDAIKRIEENKLPDPILPVGNAFCAKAVKKQAAPGDSGGGALSKGKIYGVYIGGHPDTAFKEPFFFLRVCKYLKFIDDTINKH